MLVKASLWLLKDEYRTLYIPNMLAACFCHIPDSFLLRIQGTVFPADSFLTFEFQKFYAQLCNINKLVKGSFGNLVLILAESRSSTPIVAKNA
jgi:hypothetical protein